MKTLKNSLFVTLSLPFWSILFTSCNKGEIVDPDSTGNHFVNLENLYLICPTQNSGGEGEFAMKINERHPSLIKKVSKLALG